MLLNIKLNFPRITLGTTSIATNVNWAAFRCSLRVLNIYNARYVCYRFRALAINIAINNAFLMHVIAWPIRLSFCLSLSRLRFCSLPRYFALSRSFAFSLAFFPLFLALSFSPSLILSLTHSLIHLLSRGDTSA